MVTVNELRSQIKVLEEQLKFLENDEKDIIRQGSDLKKQTERNLDEKKFVILPDTSWLVAILDKNDSHHVAANSSLGALLPYSPTFYVPVMAYMETISRLVRVNHISVKKCKTLILEFLNKKLHAMGSEVKIDFRNINQRYDLFSRKEIKKLTTIDFYIVTEGIAIGAKILTCDLKMYKPTIKYYTDIYFMSDKVEAQESDLARLIHNMQLFKK